MRNSINTLMSYIPGFFDMSFMSNMFKRKERGATMVEYAVMVALIAVAAIVIIAALGQEINNAFSDVKSCIADPSNC